MSAYWNEIAPWGEEIQVRECKNEGCKIVVYYDNNANKFKELNTGQVHSCKFYKRTGSSQGNNNQAQNNTNSSQSSNNSSGPVQSTTGIEVLLKGQLEELRRAADHLSRIAMFVESLDFRVKKIEERLTYSKVPDRPVLTSESESDEEIVGGVQEQ